MRTRSGPTSDELAAQQAADGFQVWREVMSLEDGLGSWTLAGPPEGSEAGLENWRRTQTAFEDGAGITTPDTIFLTFGVEGIATAERRAEVMGRAMRYLLRGP
jgi:hypothetical protein